jgi:solute carrier family 13 (sodium-dependent dicarboxylate transporter), member 2/3/5
VLKEQTLKAVKKQSEKSKVIRVVTGVVVPVIILLLPLSSFAINGLTVLEQRTIALFAFAALFWILEPIPIYATSIVIILLELLMLSDTSINFLKGEGVSYGTTIPYKEIMATLASPVIQLFLGGFFLAAAATKYRLDQNIAGVLLRRFGEKPKFVLFGMMGLTAFFSMFMSNTATTAMMLSILIPVLNVFPKGDKGRTGFILSIPIAANLGGIGTPIGTPPNAIALKFITGASSITFGKWMSFGVPFVLIMLVLTWLIITFLFPSDVKKIKLNLEGEFSYSPKAIGVYITFVVTILLWLFDFVHGVNSYTIAMIPVAVFLSTGIINKEDLKTISWEVLWLVAGGIALGLAIEKTGLANHLIGSIPFDQYNPYTVVVFAALIGFFMANFMSHTATSNLLLPLLAALGTTVHGMEAIGGNKIIVLSATFAISLGMSLPISSPPNALAHSTGEFQTKDLIKAGLSTGLVGLVLTLATMTLLQFLNFFS